jgi:hypothetical protein
MTSKPKPLRLKSVALRHFFKKSFYIGKEPRSGIPLRFFATTWHDFRRDHFFTSCENGITVFTTGEAMPNAH